MTKNTKEKKRIQEIAKEEHIDPRTDILFT